MFHCHGVNLVNLVNSKVNALGCDSGERGLSVRDDSVWSGSEWGVQLSIWLTSFSTDSEQDDVELAQSSGDRGDFLFSRGVKMQMQMQTSRPAVVLSATHKLQLLQPWGPKTMPAAANLSLSTTSSVIPVYQSRLSS